MNFTRTFASCMALAALYGCSSNDDVAGGITDIGNTIAGHIIDNAGNSVAAARIVAYHDNGVSLQDSLETVSDSLGNFILETKDTFNIIYVNKDSLCGMFGTEDSTLTVGKPKTLKGSIANVNSGFVRIVGTNTKVELQGDGSFAIDNIPPGSNLQLVYIQDNHATGKFEFSTTDARDTITLPPLDSIHDGKFTSSVFESEQEPSHGISYKEPFHNEDRALILHMDGSEKVYDNDSTIAQNVDYIEGIEGYAIALKAGQFINLEQDMDIASGDFTISMWVKWNGPNGNHQMLIANRSYWSDSTSKFQWHFESNEGKFTVMKCMPVEPEAIYFGDSSIIPIGEWASISLVSQRSMVSMFVNGEQVGATQKFTSNNFDRFDDGDFRQEPPEFSHENTNGKSPRDPSHAPIPFRIGGNEIDTETWNGAIDEVRIEPFARNRDWIRAMYTYQKSYIP